jgi:hypothetical protein
MEAVMDPSRVEYEVPFSRSSILASSHQCGKKNACPNLSGINTEGIYSSHYSFPIHAANMGVQSFDIRDQISEITS